MAAPPNDDFADAEVLTGSSGTVTGTNVDATFEVGEPAADDGGEGDDADVSVWYRWVATGDGDAIFDTFGSDFDTVLHVYTGASIGALSLVAANDDFDYTINRQSKVTFSATGGTTYHVRVNGYSTTGGSTDYGDIVLNWARTLSPPTAYDIPTFGGSGNMSFTWGTNFGLTSHLLTYEYMPDPPLTGDIVLGFAYQLGVDNPDLTVSAGWTVDDQVSGADGSWIVFHREITADGETGPTVSAIVPNTGWYAEFIWIYRNFHGFDGGFALDYSWTPVTDLDSPAITTTSDHTVVVIAWLVPVDDGTFDSDDRVEIRSGSNGYPDWFEIFPGVGSGAALRIYINGTYGGLPDTYGPVVARRRDIFNDTVDLATPYFCIAWGLNAELIPVGGWGVGMVRMGAA